MTPGTRIGPYEVVAPIGAGGMGEVYRARDTNLHRDVAIKILPAFFVGDPDRLSRFEREATTLAALNHQHIAQVYGFERVDGDPPSRALVMEFVEGDDLAQRIAAGPLPLDEALQIARQIAEALEYAHERGIVHRDLKPANVKLTGQGTAKVLDFGLAKATEAAGGGTTGLANSPTFTSPAVTHMGVILGTAAYMAPEQAKGKPVDRRADIWALGVVLFEMLAGGTLFAGETVTDTLAQVITQPPDWNRLPANTPAAIRRLLRRCLDKDPRKRFQSAGDVRIDLEEELAEPHDAAAEQQSARVPAPTLVRALPWAVAGLLSVALAVMVARAWRSAEDVAPPIRVETRVGTGETLIPDDNNDGALAVLSPDGSILAYAATRDGLRRIYLRPLGSLESKPLEGTDGATGHFFSPDGRWLGFFAGAQLKKIAVAGGAAVKVADAVDARGGTWGAGDTIVYTPATNEGLYRVAAAGGGPSTLTTRRDGERTHRWPSFLPGGNAVLFMRQMADGTYDDSVIEAVRLDNGERKELIRGGMYPVYLHSGHLAYVRGGTLFAVPFDPERLEVRGDPQPVLGGIVNHGGRGGGSGDGAAQVAVSANGTAAYLPGSTAELRSRLTIVDRTGKELAVFPETREFRTPTFSPDGKRIAVQVTDGTAQNIFVADFERSTLTKVTFEPSISGMPTWSPDGRYIAFFSDRVGKGSGMRIFRTRSDGAGTPEELTRGPLLQVPTQFSPDGTLLAAMEQHPKTGWDIFVLSLHDSKRTDFSNTTAHEMMPTFSPDQRWIAYSSDESGPGDVYIRPYPGPGGKWQASTQGGAFPQWTKGGRELIYIAGAMNQVMAVDVAPEGDAVKLGKPHLLFETVFARPNNGTWFDATGDGERFVLLRPERNDATVGFTHVNLIFNFFTEVRRTLAPK